LLNLVQILLSHDTLCISCIPDTPDKICPSLISGTKEGVIRGRPGLQEPPQIFYSQASMAPAFPLRNQTCGIVSEVSQQIDWGGASYVSRGVPDSNMTPYLVSYTHAELQLLKQSNKSLLQFAAFVEH